MSSPLPGFRLTLGVSLLFMGVMFLLPLVVLVLQLQQLSWADYWALISDRRVLASLRLTYGCALVASGVNLLLGLLFAWVLSRYRFPGRGLLDLLMDLPLALPTAVAGIALTTLLAPTGLLGRPLAALGLELAYRPAGIVIALVFTSLPFIVRALQPVLAALPPAPEEAARTLGASEFQIFSRVILPLLLPALVSGFMLSLARSLGEFGAVIFIAGNQPYVSEVLSLLIFSAASEYDLPRACALASLLLASTLLLLALANRWQHFFVRRLGAGL